MAYEFISKLNKITSYFLVVPKQISNKSNLCFALCLAMYNIKPSLNNIYKLFKTWKIKNEGEHKNLTTILQRLDGSNNNFRDNYPKPSSLLPLKSLQTLITLS